MNSHIRYDILFSQVARFVRTLPYGQDMFHALPAIAHRVFGDKRRAEQLNISIRSYCIQQQPVQPGMFSYCHTSLR
jgi:hypothetical protein